MLQSGGIFIDSVNHLNIIKKKNEERCQKKKNMKDINQDLSEEEKNKKDNIVASNTKICLKIKNIR